MMTKTCKLTTILCCVVAIQVGLVLISGCHHKAKHNFAANCHDCPIDLQEIEYPDVCDPELATASELQTPAPTTVKDFYEQEPWPMTLEEAIEYALANNQVLQKLGGIVVNAPQGTATVYDPAIQETDPGRSVEAALSDFDAQFRSNLSWSHTEREFNNAFAGFGQSTRTFDAGNLDASISKIAASGTQFSINYDNDYSRNPDFQFFFDAAGNQVNERFKSYWDSVVDFQVRQPLLRGAGTAVNRIAGANPIPGVYNGVLIARIQGDVALADFEAAVRDLVRDVEAAYWELYFAYRNVDVQTRAREAARLIWDNRKKRVDAGLSRPDDEAQARQTYFQFDLLVLDAVAGNAFGQSGLLGSERQLRRLLGLLNTDGRLIRPITEPTIAPVRFNWDEAQQRMLVERVELRRQKWVVRQRELELFAARKLNKWQVDLVGNYGTRGFGNNLFGNAGAPDSVQTIPFVPAPTGRSSTANLFTGQLDQFSIALEVQGPVGLRQGHLAVRNAELLLVRDKTLLREQQKQLLLDLNAAFNEVDRGFESIKSNYNRRRAVLAELEPKRKRAEAGDEDIFFLLDALQRAAVNESAFHRAVVDYNLALQNFVYTSGGMLGHYNVRLLEGDWNQCAEIDATQKGQRFRSGQGDPNMMDICPITDGPVRQLPDLMQEQADGVAPDMPAPDAELDQQIEHAPDAESEQQIETPE